MVAGRQRGGSGRGCGWAAYEGGELDASAAEDVVRGASAPGFGRGIPEVWLINVSSKTEDGHEQPSREPLEKFRNYLGEKFQDLLVPLLWG